MNTKNSFEQTHASASQIAAALSITARGVQQQAEKQGWPFIERAARGGRRRLYAISCLPAETQAALAEKILSAAPAAVQPLSSLGAGGTPATFLGAHSSSTPALGSEAGTSSAGSGATPDARSQSLAAAFDGKPEALKAEARARLAIVQEYHRLRMLGFDRAAVVAAVTREREISEATLWRYLGMVKGEPEHLWFYLLVPRHRGRTVTGAMSAEAWEFLKAEYLTPERRSAAACIDRLRRAAKARLDWKIPSNRTLLRRLEQIPRRVKVLAREGRKAALALYPAQQRVRAALAALSIANADGYKHNLWVRFHDGEIVRAKTWYWQDVYSSKILAWRTDKTEHTDVIRLSFGDLCERYGIPDKVLLDNTLAAANKTMSGGVRHRYRFRVREEEPLGVFSLLIGPDPIIWATPDHGQAKPIERAFGAGGVGEYIDKAPEFAGAWTGSSTEDKPEYDGRHRAIELSDLERVVEREIAAWNAREGRRSPLHRGRSCDAVFAESYARITVRRATEAQRRLWLLATEEIPVGRDGTIKLDSGRMVGERLANRYWAADLVDLAGRNVVARFDPQELHEGVHVYSADGRYICFAECVDPAAFNDRAAAREHSRARRAFVRAAKEQLAAERRMNELQTARLLAAATDGMSVPAVIPAPKVLRPEFRHPLERPRYIPRERTPDEIADLARLEAKFAAPRPVNVIELGSDTERHAYWKALDQRRAAGETLPEQDEDFWRAWQSSEHFCLVREANEEFERMLQRRAMEG